MLHRPVALRGAPTHLEVGLRLLGPGLDVVLIQHLDKVRRVNYVYILMELSDNKNELRTDFDCLALEQHQRVSSTHLQMSTCHASPVEQVKCSVFLVSFNLCMFGADFRVIPLHLDVVVIIELLVLPSDVNLGSPDPPGGLVQAVRCNLIGLVHLWRGLPR